MDNLKQTTEHLAKLPQYQSHKKVRAAKIVAVDVDAEGLTRLILDTEGIPPFPVTSDFVSKHAPKAGMYLVVYDDGYLSISPAKAFDEGYTRLS